jgi:hypothetical protein
MSIQTDTASEFFSKTASHLRVQQNKISGLETDNRELQEKVATGDLRQELLELAKTAVSRGQIGDDIESVLDFVDRSEARIKEGNTSLAVISEGMNYSVAPPEHTTKTAGDLTGGASGPDPITSLLFGSMTE